VERYAKSDGFVKFHGFIGDPARKAQIAAKTQALILPGRVGLAVLDAFALGLPVIASRYAGNAPEFEYLEDGQNAVIAAEASPRDLANAAEPLLYDGPLRARLSEGARASAEMYDIESMAARFANGIIQAMSS
jgi:glycosyltransferase involved in cell wall biosynthesis